MLAWESVVEVKALRARGWSISAIARHLDINRRTVRRYLDEAVVPQQRRRLAPDGFEAFVPYVRQRLVDDPHLWATALYDELVELGYAGSYPSLTRALRARELRPHCEACQGVRGRDAAIIDHPPGEETQWDWLELPDPPAGWGWGKHAHLLVGSLAYSSQWRAVLADCEDQPHLIEALDGVVRRLGGVTKRWRFDRMSTVCHPESGSLLASFGPVAVHYSVGIDICPPRRGTGAAADPGHLPRPALVVARHPVCGPGPLRRGRTGPAAKPFDFRRRPGRSLRVCRLASSQQLA
jgi:transposase